MNSVLTTIATIPDTVPDLQIDAMKCLAAAWLFFVIFGIGRLGLFFNFGQLPRFERYALRIAVGISAMIVIGVVLNSVGFNIGLSNPRYHTDDGFPAVRPGPLGFRASVLLFFALAGYALDIRDWVNDRRAGNLFILFPGLRNADGRISFAAAVNYFGPGSVVALTALYWFDRFYAWAMSYAWLADNDPWDHAWATDWILRSGDRKSVV